jgi:hypothetical protein
MPSTIATNPGPCDSPAVVNLKELIDPLAASPVLPRTRFGSL